MLVARTLRQKSKEKRKPLKKKEKKYIIIPTMNRCPSNR